MTSETRTVSQAPPQRSSFKADVAESIDAGIDRERRFIDSCSDTLRRRASRYAARRLAGVTDSGHTMTTSYADEVVNDALADIWADLSSWDPDSRPLLAEVCNRVRRRLWREARRAALFPHQSLDIDSGEPSACAPAAPSEPDTDTCAILDSLFAVLRARAAGQCDELEVLACRERGVVDRDDVIASTGLPPHAYDAARRRLRRWARGGHAKASPEPQQIAAHLECVRRGASLCGDIESRFSAA
jgi:hypothetical protein